MNLSEPERRQYPRYLCRDAEVLVGWDGEGVFETVRAQLLDINPIGAGLSVDGQLPGQKSVRIRLADDDGAEWTPAIVVGFGANQEGRLRVSLKFVEGCPADLFRAATERATKASDAGSGPAPVPSAHELATIEVAREVPREAGAEDADIKLTFVLHRRSALARLELGDRVETPAPGAESLSP